jgi:sulfopyruvate decarboxylase subunit alpha
MTVSEHLYQKLKEQGLNFFVSVPCKLLDELISLMENDHDIIYTPVTREEEGVGILAGSFLAGKKPSIVMQNSGFGNCINAICSLLNYYKLPIVFIISHRGTSGEKIEAQKPMGHATKDLLKAVNIEFYEIQEAQQLHLLESGIKKAYDRQRSVAFLFPFSFWKN